VTLAEAPNPEAAAAFVELVRSEEGQQSLADAGFRIP
jgi:molybdate transport system substrate-binding protein